MPGEQQRFLVWGSGAIGGTVGAYLARAGHAVTFVDLVEEHIERICTPPGLRITVRRHCRRCPQRTPRAAARVCVLTFRVATIQGPVDEFSVVAPAVLPPDLEGQWDIVFLAVKAHHTRAAAEALAAHLSPDGYVVSFQNGLNELEIADVVGIGRTVGAFVNYGCDYQQPGEIMFGNHGAVVLGELDGSASSRVVALQAVLSAAFNPDAVVTDNMCVYYAEIVCLIGKKSEPFPSCLLLRLRCCCFHTNLSCSAALATCGASLATARCSRQRR
jgi:2-dehydropantoate 2-reductase